MVEPGLAGVKRDEIEIAEGRIGKGTDVDLATSIIGMVVRAGAPKPDISTVEALKQALKKSYARDAQPAAKRR